MNVLEAWFSKACEDLQLGEELYLETENKTEAHNKRKALIKIKGEFEKLDPVAASYIDIKVTFKLDKFWVVLRKRAASPLVALKKEASGRTRKVSLSADLARERRIKLMLADGMGLEEVEAIEGRLNKMERELFANKTEEGTNGPDRHDSSSAGQGEVQQDG